MESQSQQFLRSLDKKLSFAADRLRGNLDARAGATCEPGGVHWVRGCDAHESSLVIHHSALTRAEELERLGHLAEGAAYPAVRPEVIGALKVYMPKQPTILNAFHTIYGPLSAQTEANRHQSRALAILRDTLLPKLLSGSISVNHSNRRQAL